MGDDGTINYKLTILNFLVTILIGGLCFKSGIDYAYEYFTSEYVPLVVGVTCLIIMKHVASLNNKIFAFVYN